MIKLQRNWLNRGLVIVKNDLDLTLLNLFFPKTLSNRSPHLGCMGLKTMSSIAGLVTTTEDRTSKWQQQITRWIVFSFLRFTKWGILALPCYTHADVHMGKTTKAFSWESSVQVDVPRAASFQLFIYPRSYQRWLLYKVIFWTCAALSGGWSESLSLNHKGLLWNCETCPFMTLVGEEFIYFSLLVVNLEHYTCFKHQYPILSRILFYKANILVKGMEATEVQNPKGN